MAEGFELYQQQSRRDKLRLVTGCVEDLGLLPLYDPFSSSSTHMLSCANTTTTSSTTQSSMKQHQGSSNFTTLLMPTATHSIMGRGIVNNSNNNDSCSLDPQPVHDLDNGQCSFVYTNQDFRLIHHHHQPFHGGGDNLVLYKPEALALSLSSHNTHNRNLPLELNLQRYESTIYGGEGGDFGRSAVSPLGLFTGYASILKGSRFLKPAQQLLEEICDVGFGIYAEKFAVDYGMMIGPPPLESLRTSVDDSNCGDAGGGDGRKKSRLIYMLDEVYKRYKQYHQQIQAVIASFEAVSGLSNVAPFAFMDLRAMSKHFRCLKKAITDQLQFSAKTHEHHISYGKEEAPRSGSSDGGLYGQRPVNNSRFVDHQPVWRPQRGLPERAVTVLRAWLFDHFLHPYPTDTDKLMLAKQTGLSRNQVSNWFINARVRLWKPMVEEIHVLETRQLKKATSQIEEQDTLPQGNSELPRDKSSTTSPQRIKNPPSKRTRNDFTSDHPMAGNEEPMNLLYEKFSRHQQLGSAANGGRINRGVSLTLGLHQNNNGIALSEPFPLNAARRFGLDASSESFIIGREIIGGQLLHDFVG